VIRRIAESGTAAQAQLALDRLARLVPEPERDRADAILSYKEWAARLRERAARAK
jgi:hypothetical protein